MTDANMAVNNPEDELQLEDLKTEVESSEVEERKELTDDEKEERSKRIAALNMELPQAVAGGKPSWALVPSGFKFPRGKQIIFLKFKSAWTDTPWKGDPIVDPETGEPERDEKGNPVLYRQCICWPLNLADKKLAFGRSMQDPNRVADELARQMIRAIDGVQTDLAVVQNNGIEVFWNELGEKCRGLLIRIYTRLHVMDVDDTRDFLENCVAVRSTAS